MSRQDDVKRRVDGVLDHAVAFVPGPQADKLTNIDPHIDPSTGAQLKDGLMVAWSRYSMTLCCHVVSHCASWLGSNTASVAGLTVAAAWAASASASGSAETWVDRAAPMKL